MQHRITSWLESLGRHIMLNGWCDMYGTSIPPVQYWTNDPPNTQPTAEAPHLDQPLSEHRSGR